jgi:predicted dehydrogenase
MGQIGVGIIGCGYWGINYVRVFSELPETRVVVVCDRSAERLQEARRRFPSIPVTTDLGEVLKMSTVDVAIVCTEATSHYAVVCDCLANGKHVLVEKPMTTRVADGARLVELAESKGLRLMVGHTFLYNVGIRKVKAYITHGDVGRVYYIYARRTNLGPIRRDVNALWDLAPHDVSIFNYLLDGTPEWVSAVGACVLGNGREDVGFISLGYPNNVIGHAQLSWADPHKVREVVVVGSDKRIVFDDLNAQELVRVFEKGVKLMEPAAPTYGEYQFLMRDGDIIIPKIEASEPLKNQCKHFLECVIQGSSPLTDGKFGLDIVRVMVAVDRSVEQRGTPVQVT